MERVRRWDGETGIGFLAMEDENACGIAGAYLEPEDATQAHLVSMWTAPSHRRRGVGRLLLDKVFAWAGRRGARNLCLLVTSNNRAAIRFYECLGFSRTGRTEPYPNDPSVPEYQTRRPLYVPRPAQPPRLAFPQSDPNRRSPNRGERSS